MCIGNRDNMPMWGRKSHLLVQYGVVGTIDICQHKLRVHSLLMPVYASMCIMIYIEHTANFEKVCDFIFGGYTHSKFQVAVDMSTIAFQFMVWF